MAKPKEGTQMEVEGAEVPKYADSPLKDSLQTRLNYAVKRVMDAEVELRRARVEERTARKILAEADD